MLPWYVVRAVCGLRVFRASVVNFSSKSGWKVRTSKAKCLNPSKADDRARVLAPHTPGCAPPRLGVLQRRLPARSAVHCHASRRTRRGDGAVYPAHDLGPLFHDVQMARSFLTRRPSRCRPLQSRRRRSPGATPPSKARPGFDLGHSWTSTSSRLNRRRRSRSTRAQRWRSTFAAVAGAHAPGATRRAALVAHPAAQSVRRPGWPIPRGLLLGFLLHDARSHRERPRSISCATCSTTSPTWSRTVGHIPNGNRTYYLGRSQPPYFAAMVGLYAAAADTTHALQYLDALEAEYAFWMDGADRLRPGTAYRRVVRLPDGALLNRYWDDRSGAETRVVPRGLHAGADACPTAQRDRALSQPARVGGERMGLLEPLDARSDRSPHARDDGSHAGGPEQPAVSRRADDRRASAPPRADGDVGPPRGSPRRRR